MKYSISLLTVIFLALLNIGCQPDQSQKEDQPKQEVTSSSDEISLDIASFNGSSDSTLLSDSPLKVEGKGWLSYDLNIPKAGRYQIDLYASSNEGMSQVWIEDYIDNKDGRNYDITGKFSISNGDEIATSSKFGSPLNKGLHKVKLHYNGSLTIEKLTIQLMREHQKTPETLTQNMDGEEWEVVWADEFDGTSIDTSKWLFDIGDWGWGNNELQYYTNNNGNNARVEDGKLIIEATKNQDGKTWKSARLTTRGKTTFLYGKIEFSAKVPKGKGTWAAGWTLGDSYVDELSWPYCGEIDILETVGYEMKGNDGIAHATVHTPAYYFKINNQISSVKDVPNVTTEFHTYAVEWTPTEVRGYVDGEHYYTYDKNANELEWPFDKPQNIILNLAMGGGWGGAMGMDESLTSQEFVIDYVRVSQLK